MSEKNFTPPPTSPDWFVRHPPEPVPAEVENVWDRLLDAALALDAALQYHAGRLEYTGSFELVAVFRAAVLEAHHVRSG